MKYKTWKLNVKKLKSGWKTTGKRKTEYGIQTIVQQKPYSKTRKESIIGTIRQIKSYYGGIK